MKHKVEIIYKNIDGDTLTFGNFAPYYCLSYSGFGNAENDIQSQELWGYDGAQRLSSRVNIRDIEIINLIKADSFEELQELKRKAIHVLNPKKSGTLIYKVLNNTYEIDVEVIKGIDNGAEQTSLTLKSALQFKALDPYWRDVSFYNRLIPLNEVVNLFKFPLNITNNFKFAEMIPSKITEIVNNGDAVVGGVFTLRFTKDVTEPKILEVKTQKYFAFNRSFKAGDVVTINTLRGNKSVTFKEQGKEEVNAMTMRQPGSSFLQLDNSDINYFKLQAKKGVDGIIANLKFVPLVLGV